MNDLVEVHKWVILLGAWSTAVVIPFAFIIIIRWFISVHKHQRSKRMSQERRLLLIERKLESLGRRIHVPNWEHLDD